MTSKTKTNFITMSINQIIYKYQKSVYLFMPVNNIKYYLFIL